MARLASFLCLTVFRISLAWAQDYGVVAPKIIVPEQPAGVAVLPPEPAPKPQSDARLDKVIISSLEGLLVVDTPRKIVPNGLTGQGVFLYLFARPEWHAELEEKLNAFLHKPFTLRQRNAISQTIVALYRAHGYPVVDVSFPPQNVSYGLVQIVVTEFHAGKITVKGNKWFSDDQIRAAFHIQPGDPIETSQLQEDLNWANSNPFRHVDAVLQKGAEAGTTDINLVT